MRSRLSRRRVCALLLPLFLLTLGSSGCQLNRSFFEMNSDSRVPFFGVDLAAKWPGKRTSSVDGVSRLQSEGGKRSDQPTSPGADPSTPQRKTLPVSDAIVEVEPGSDAAPVEMFR